MSDHPRITRACVCGCGHAASGEHGLYATAACQQERETTMLTLLRGEPATTHTYEIRKAA